MLDVVSGFRGLLELLRDAFFRAASLSVCECRRGHRLRAKAFLAAYRANGAVFGDDLRALLDWEIVLFFKPLRKPKASYRRFTICHSYSIERVNSGSSK